MLDPPPGDPQAPDDDLERVVRLVAERNTRATGDSPIFFNSLDDATLDEEVARPEEEGIDPRQWAYGGFLLRRSAAVLGGRDGGGKGALAVAMTFCFITGRPLLGEKVWTPGPVAIISYEDTIEEWRRRIIAACRHYGISSKQILPHIHFITKKGDRITFAVIDARGGVARADGDLVIAKLKTIKPALLIVDPFNLAHNLDDGNNNSMIAKVAAELVRVAEESDCAAMVLHHLRKSKSGDADDLMGATALRATFRSTRMIVNMTENEAASLNTEDAWRYIRFSGSKENYAPPPDKAVWMKLESVRLENGTDLYPNGDSVGVITSWTPPRMFDGMEEGGLRRAFGEYNRTPHAKDKRARKLPWAGKPLMKEGLSERQAASVIKSWIDNGVMVVSEYNHGRSQSPTHQVQLVPEMAQKVLLGKL